MFRRQLQKNCANDKTGFADHGQTLCCRAVAAMQAAGIKVSYHKFATGRHSFGIGAGTPADGWMERVLAFAAAFVAAS